MANTFTPTDVYGIVNAMSKEMFGSEQTLQAVDTTTFVSVGEKMLRAGKTNTLDALSVVLSKTIYVARRYGGRFQIVLKTDEQWGGRVRKISFYSTKLEESFNRNTDLNPAILNDGQSSDHYKINKAYPLEVQFIGEKLMEFSDTTWISQLKAAFRSPEEFGNFVAAKLVRIANDFQIRVDAQNRLQILNAMGATYNVGAERSKVNLTQAFNDKFGTSYTTEQLKTEHLADFMAFFVARLEGDMELMREENELFHIYPARNDDSGNPLTLLRHTEPADRRLILYAPLLRDEAKHIFPTLFNTSELRIENFEKVEYWQNPNLSESMKINVKPNQLNVESGEAEDGDAVQLDNVVGFLFDKNAIYTAVKHESALTTPVNARGEYYNTFYHWTYNYCLDQTENMVLYYMAD